MGYKKPVCECGAELEYVNEVTMDEIRKINVNGKLSKRVKISSWMDNGISFLRCTDYDCNNKYEYDYDDRDRIIRGEKLC